ncbi:uncharacterized protein [Rutidosis leptorrhynchoides]|uniref:uncharacterized protein n=1 Tax=Rutidosis leptorrhynchoides TaxID=125765 RepID=UPI003A992D78
MDIDLQTEHGPTEETVEALMDYLVGPLLPLKVSDIANAPSESQQKSVAKQVHAVAILYNYYHRIHHQKSEFLKFDQFCCLAIMFKPSILHHFKYMSKSDRPVLDDPEKQLSLAEKAIMDACTISKTLLDATTNGSCSVKEWPISKVAVLLIDSKKENCFLQFNDGVWSLIEKDLYSEKEYEKKRLRKYDEDEEVGFAFIAVKEATGIIYNKLKVLKSDVVYSLSHAKTSTRFYVMQCTQSINEDNLVPIQDAIRSLQGPVVKKCSGSWIITPIVEYYYLLPYADIISKLFSRVSNSVPHQVEQGSADTSSIQGSLITSATVSGKSKKLSDNLMIKSNFDLGSVHISNSSKEETHDHNVAEPITPISEVLDDVVTSKLIGIPFDQKVKEPESSVGNKIKSNLDVGLVESSNSRKEEAHDHNVALKFVDPKSEPMVLDDVVTSKLIENPFDQKVKETESSVGDKITGVNGDNKKSCEIVSGESKKLSDDLIFKSNKIKSTLDVGSVHSSNSSKEESHDHNVELNFVDPKCEPMVLDDSKLIGKPFDQKVKETKSSVGYKVTGANGDSKKSCEMVSGQCKKLSDDLIFKSNLDVGSVHSSKSIKEEAHDHNVALNFVNQNDYSSLISKVLDMGKPFNQKVKDTKSQRNKITGANSSGKNSCEAGSGQIKKVKETESSVGNKVMGANGDSKKSCEIESGQSKKVKETESYVGNTNVVIPNNYREPVSEVQDDVVTSNLIGKPFDQKVKETESSVGNKITGANGDSKKACEIGSDEIKKVEKTERYVLIVKPFDQKVKETESSVSNNITSANGDSKKSCEIGSDEIKKVKEAERSVLIVKPFDQKVKETESSVGNKITGANGDSMKKSDMNGSCKAESNNSSSEASSKGIDKPFKVYHHEKRKTTKGISIEENLKNAKNMSTVSQKKDKKVDGENNSCMVLYNEDKILTVNHAFEEFHLTENMSTVSQKKDEKVDGENNSCMVLCSADREDFHLTKNMSSVSQKKDVKVDGENNSCMVLCSADREDFHLTKNMSNVSQKKDVKVDGENNSCMVLCSEDKILTVNHAREVKNMSIVSQKKDEKVDGEKNSCMVLFNEDKLLTVDHAREDFHFTKNMPTVSQKRDEKVDGGKNSCMVLCNEDKILTVDHALDDFHLTVDAKSSELSKAAVRALLHKRRKLCDQQHYIESELTLCDKKIQAIMHAGDGDCLGLKIEAVIDCCNEICQQDNMQPQEHTNLHGDRSLAMSVNSKACQDLDEICLSNSWMLPSYRTTCSNGMYVANVTIKGLEFECSGVSGLQPSLHEAKNSAAMHLITKLQQMAGELNTALP